VFTHLLLADEINRAPAKTQAALLEVRQEGQVTIEGRTFELPRPFMVLTTQNPIEQEGTYPLPEAQLDRFLLKVLIRYPEAEEVSRLVRQVTAGQLGDALDVSAVETVITAAAVESVRARVADIGVDDRIVAYAVRLVRGTREWPGIALGAGPRGSIALVRTARAAAVLAERDYVIPDDIKAVALPALRHHIALSPELDMEGSSGDDVLRALLEKVEAPRH
jgi:MoxR-like ATPase